MDSAKREAIELVLSEMGHIIDVTFQVTGYALIFVTQESDGSASLHVASRADAWETLTTLEGLLAEARDKLIQEGLGMPS